MGAVDHVPQQQRTHLQYQVGTAGSADDNSAPFRHRSKILQKLIWFCRFLFHAGVQHVYSPRWGKGIPMVIPFSGFFV